MIQIFQNVSWYLKIACNIYKYILIYLYWNLYIFRFSIKSLKYMKIFISWSDIEEFHDIYLKCIDIFVYVWKYYFLFEIIRDMYIQGQIVIYWKMCKIFQIYVYIANISKCIHISIDSLNIWQYLILFERTVYI